MTRQVWPKLFLAHWTVFSPQELMQLQLVQYVAAMVIAKTNKI